MNQGLIDYTKCLLAVRNAGKWVDVRDDDVFIVSYPKSGNTWVRFLVANLLTKSNQKVDLSNIEKLVPDIYLHNIYYFHKYRSPRYLKSHECFDPSYKKVIYIVRDPRDIVISYWRFQIKKRFIPKDYPLEKFVEGFVIGEIGGAFGTWGKHVGSWLGARENDPDFLLVRYEDLLSNPQKEVEEIASHLNLSPSPDEILRTIEQSTFSMLHGMEIKQASKWKALDGTRKDELFFRIGKSGAWRSDLPLHLAHRIYSHWSCLLAKLGYKEQ